MEKRFFALMTVAAVAAALVSCNREKEVEVVEPAGDVTYRFELVGGTRATLDDDGVWWEANDHVGVFLGSQDNEAEVKGSDTKYVEVTTSQSNISKGYAYYPYNANSAVSDDKVYAIVSFPAAQTGGSNSAMPMAGIPFDVTSGSFNGQIHFLNLGSVIDFRVYSPSGKYAGELVKSITFAATAGSHLAGSAKLNLAKVDPADETTLAVSWTGGSPVSSVTLTQSSASAMDKVTAAGRHLYMVVAPGTYSGTITIETNAATYSYNIANPGKTFVRGGLQRFNMDLEHAGSREAYYKKITSADQMVDGGTYLIAYESNSTTAQVFHPVLDGSSFTGSVVVNVPIADNKIRCTESVDACQVVLVNTSDNEYTIMVPGAGNRYLSLNNGSLGVGLTTSVVTLNSNNRTIKREVTSWYQTQTYCLSYSSSTPAFSSSTSTTNSKLALYLLDQPKVQPMHFGPSVFDYSLAEPAGADKLPHLEGAKTTVTYSSSNPSVADVNASTGVVSVYAVGKTTITAIAAATEEYRETSASYTLNVFQERLFSVENDRVAAFLDYEEGHPYDPSNYAYTYVLTFRNNPSAPSETNRLDLPKPVPVTWTTSVSNPTVLIYNDPAHTDEVIMAYTEIVNSTSANVYNLIPGGTYYYVVKEGQLVRAEGSFRTNGRRRMIKVGDSPFGPTYANNCRDFGGQITTDGKHVKFGKIYRGTNMDQVTDVQKSYLIDKMGVRLDVDLRVQGTTISSEKNPSTTALGSQVTRTPEQYNSWSDLTNKTSISGTLGAIFDYVNNNKGAVYIHCKIGSDRTGYVCLLLEALLGIPQHLCDVDYELTSFCGCLDGGNTRTRDNTNESWYYYRRDGITFLSSQPEGNTLQEKAVYYVTHDLGFTTEQVTAFQNAMLESK